MDTINSTNSNFKSPDLKNIRRNNIKHKSDFVLNQLIKRPSSHKKINSFNLIESKNNSDKRVTTDKGKSKNQSSLDNVIILSNNRLMKNPKRDRNSCVNLSKNKLKNKINDLECNKRVVMSNKVEFVNITPRNIETQRIKDKRVSCRCIVF